MISWDTSYPLVDFHVEYETWSNLQSDDFDALGSGYYEWLTQCNYDQTIYQFSNPP